jgi:hypothetical protein
MRTVVSSPMRFEKWNGYCITVLNLEYADTGERCGSMHQAISNRSWAHAKKLFWTTWREENPNEFLKPRQHEPAKTLKKTLICLRVT